MGEWRTLQVDWSRPAQATCRLCGRPLFGRIWSAQAEGKIATFCDPECERLFHDYWLPRHRAAAPGAS